MVASNTYGRQVVLPLTNKSGGSVAAGDVVVIDTANNDSFTTNTAGAFTGGVGIATGTIASNAVGLVLISGYASLVNVNAAVTRGNFGKTHTVAKQATDAGATRGVGTFCQFLTAGATPDALVYPVDLLGSSLTNPMTTAEDLIKGGAAGAPARLAAGAAGGVLAMGNSAVIWNAGTAFPASKATNDRYWRTDLGLEFLWDGTQWASTCLLTHPMEPDPGVNTGHGTTAFNLARTGVPWIGTYTLYLVRYEAFTQVNTTLNGSNYWTVKLNWAPANDSADTQLGSTLTTAADTVTNWSNHGTTIGSVLSGSAATLKMRIDPVGSPGGFVGNARLYYRIVTT